MNCLLFAILYRKRFNGKIALRRYPCRKQPFGHWVIRTEKWDIMYGMAQVPPIWKQFWYQGKIMRRKPRTIR